MDNPITQRIDSLEKNGKDYVNKLISGEVFGFSTGFEILDNSIGRIEPGTLTILGGYTGTGKSFFVANMINGTLNDEYKIPNIVVFSSELSEFDYVRRFVLMKTGIYKIQLQTKNDFQQDYIRKFKEAYESFIEDMRLNPYQLQIVKIKKFNDIENYLENCEKKPDLIYIDWLQQLSIVTDDKKTLYDEKDTMPIISDRIDSIRLKYNLAIVAVSQINNYMSNTDFNSNQLNPFSYGKQIAQIADNSLVITRERFNGQRSPVMTSNILKGRDGSGEPVNFNISNGFNLRAIPTVEAKRIKSRWKEEVGNYGQI